MVPIGGFSNRSLLRGVLCLIEVGLAGRSAAQTKQTVVGNGRVEELRIHASSTSCARIRRHPSSLLIAPQFRQSVVIELRHLSSNLRREYGRLPAKNLLRLTVVAAEIDYIGGPKIIR